MSFEWLSDPITSPDVVMMEQALERQQQLSKPPGSLGQLEQLACRLSAMQGRTKPQLDKVQISVFAADHGVVEEGVSAFPQSVTVEMLKNFSADRKSTRLNSSHGYISYAVFGLKKKKTQTNNNIVLKYSCPTE